MSLYCVRLATILLPVFSYLPLSPPAPHPLHTYPPPSLTPPLLSASPPLGQSSPNLTNSEKTRLLYSNQITHRGTGSVALQYIERPDSASFLMYTPIYSKSASSIAAAIGGYYPPPPPPLPMPPWMPPVDPSRDPVLEAAQGPLHTGSQDPRLWPKKKHHLDDCL